jgi:PIN domain nuclease of toxin-antitoxin system
VCGAAHPPECRPATPAVVPRRAAFDRLLVAPAQREGATIVAKDAVLARDGVDVAW